MSQDRHPTEDLPAYALGALERDERRVIAAHLEACPVCAERLGQFEDALYEAGAIGAVNVDPPADLRTRIVLRHRGAKVLNTTSWADRMWDLLGAPIPAAIPLALGLLLALALGVVGSTKQQVDTYSSALAGVVDGRVVALAPTDVNPDARAAVVIPNQGSPYLIARLPPPPAGKAWEAWVLKGSVAVPAGTSERGDVFTLSLTAPLGAGDGVAITLEPAIGSAQPTTEPVLALAKT